MNQSLQFIVIIALVCWPAAVAAANSTNFDACLSNVQAGLFGVGTDIGGTDNHGHPVNVSVATAVTYELCLVACGARSAPFSWNVFSQQFNSWLFPWFALISQLPFGANDKMDNMVSMLLTVGSPTLAAYSLILTILNDRWIARRFSDFTYPNSKRAIRVLSSLQQAPLKIKADSGLLECLVVLPQNDKWWSELIDDIDSTYTWSISAASSTILVILAFLFTLIDSFTGDLTSAINANGQAIGSLWLWLLPIIIGWLRMSPKCDSVHLQRAINRANSIAYVATTDGTPILANHVNQERAFELSTEVDNLRTDEKRTVPIYNYARLFPWVQTVEKVAKVFEATSVRYRKHHSVKGREPEVPWVTIGMDKRPSDENRTGTMAQVRKYCLLHDDPDSHGNAVSSAEGVVNNSPLSFTSHARNRIITSGEPSHWHGQSNSTTTALPSSIGGGRSSSIDSILLQEFDSGSCISFIDQEPAAGVIQKHDRSHTNWGSGRLSRIVIASVLALGLQWGTAGSAIIVAWFTPTIGLGCRSFSYLLYAALSTIVWMLLVASSILTHYSTAYFHYGWWRTMAMRFSIAFRRLGKFIAALNALLILAACIFQISNLYNNCFCNSNVFSLRGTAYNVIKFGADETLTLMNAWIAGAAVAATSAILYTVIAIVLINPMPTDKS